MSDTNKNNGIAKFNDNGDIYEFWLYAKIVIPYIKKFLIENFLIENSSSRNFIVSEFNHIDFVVLGENIPVEIQATSIDSKYNRPRPKEFEISIRGQIEDNIENYGICWFFFDSEYLRYMQKGLFRSISINMEWFRKYMQEEKLRVFVVKYDGIVRETYIKDFDFLTNISTTSGDAYYNDDRILNRNKLKILYNVLNGYNFKQHEIDDIEDRFKFRHSNETFKSNFLLKEGNDREKLYGYISYALNDLNAINMILDLKIKKLNKRSKSLAKFIGIFYMEGKKDSAITRLVDRFDICQYFPGYLRNVDTWNNLKGHGLNNRQFDNIVMKGCDTTKGIDYFWYKEI